MSEVSPEPTVYPTQTQLAIRFIELANNYSKYARTVGWGVDDEGIVEVRRRQWGMQNIENIETINRLLSDFGGLACRLALDEEEKQLYTLQAFKGFDEQGRMVWQIGNPPAVSSARLPGNILVEELRSQHIYPLHE